MIESFVYNRLFRQGKTMIGTEIMVFSLKRSPSRLMIIIIKSLVIC